MSDIKAVESGAEPADVHPDKLNISEHDLELERALADYVPDSDAEKRLVRKVDMIMMPTLWFMYILAYIDRQNIVGSSPCALRECWKLTATRAMRKSREWTWISACRIAVS